MNLMFLNQGFKSQTPDLPAFTSERQFRMKGNILQECTFIKRSDLIEPARIFFVYAFNIVKGQIPIPFCNPDIFKFQVTGTGVILNKFKKIVIIGFYQDAFPVSRQNVFSQGIIFHTIIGTDLNKIPDSVYSNTVQYALKRNGLNIM